eukprot:352427-Chlamydomonas_euryale.AAC.12
MPTGLPTYPAPTSRGPPGPPPLPTPPLQATAFVIACWPGWVGRPHPFPCREAPPTLQATVKIATCGRPRMPQNPQNWEGLGAGEGEGVVRKEGEALNRAYTPKPWIGPVPQSFESRLPPKP